MNLLLAVGLVVQNHVSGCAPEMRANGSQGHVGRAELGRKDQHIEIKNECGESYNLLAIQLEILLRCHLISLRLIGVRRIDTLGHIGKDLLCSEHAVGIEPGAIVGAICRTSSGAGSTEKTLVVRLLEAAL